MTCCSSSETNRTNSNAPEFNKPFDPVKAGNCATCDGFGTTNDTGVMSSVPVTFTNLVPINLSIAKFPTNVPKVITNKLTRQDFLN